MQNSKSERTGRTVTREEKKVLETAACRIRMGIIESTHGAKSGHPGGSLSAADVFAYLYFKELRIDPQDPAWPQRDRFVLSKGHTAPGLYSALALRGYFPLSELKNLRHIGSMLQGHPNMNDTPGVDMSTGSLGQGVSAAAGMALAAKHLGSGVRVYTLLGDGEIEEGEVWEAFMFAAHYKLSNFTAIIDNNGLQIDGPIDKVMSSYPIDEKLAAFGFDVFKADGNDLDSLEEAFEAARKTDKPACILMKTVKGKGVSFMENQVGWHGKAPNDEEYATAMDELGAQLKRLEAE
jgi:transketolase